MMHPEIALINLSIRLKATQEQLETFREHSTRGEELAVLNDLDNEYEVLINRLNRLDSALARCYVRSRDRG